MATYYVKNGGSDAANGLSDANAWATIAKVNATTLNAGDIVYLARGSLWREQISGTNLGNGTAGNPITFTAYGSGAKPELRGTTLVTSWSNLGSNVWQATLSGAVTARFIWNQSDSRRDDPKTSLGAVVNAGDWYHDTAANALYIWSIGDPVSVEATNVTHIVTLFGAQDYITFDDVCLSRSSGDAWVAGDCDNFVRQNCEWSWLYTQDLSLFNSNSNFSVLRCLAHDCGGSGITFPAAITGTCLIQNNEVHHCVFLDDAGIAEQDSAGAIKIFGNGAGGTVTISNNYIHDCTAIDVASETNGPGIWVDTWADTTVTVRNNIIATMSHSGILLEFGGGWSCYGNLIYSCGSGASLAPRGWYSGIGQYRSHGCLIYNNTIYGCQWGYNVEGVGSGSQNAGTNVVKNNIMVSSVAYNLHLASGALENTTIIAFNCFDLQHASFLNYAFSDKSTYVAFEAAYGSSTQSIELDPLLQNPTTDLRLSSISPCRRRGLTWWSSAPTDVVGRLYANAPDLGAYQSDLLPEGTQSRIHFQSWS